MSQQGHLIEKPFKDKYSTNFNLHRNSSSSKKTTLKNLKQKLLSEIIGQPCENADVKVSDHFVEVNKTIEIGKGGQRELEFCL